MEWKTIKWLNLSKNKVSYTNGQKKSYSYMLTFATIILWLEFYATNRVVTKGRGPGAGDFPRLLRAWSPATFVVKLNQKSSRKFYIKKDISIEL